MLGAFERFVSRRYLFSHQSKRLVSFITFISIAGVAVGVAALIIVIAVIEGIDRDIIGKFIEIYPHLKIESAEGELTDPESVLSVLETRGEIALAEAVIDKQVLFERGADPGAPKIPGRLIGVHELGEGNLYDIPNTATGGNIDLQDREVLLGAPLAHFLGQVSPGEQVIATTGQLVRTPAGWMSRRRNLTILGIYQTGVYDFDNVSAFVSLDTAREVFGGEGVDYIHVKLKDPFTGVERLAGEIQSRLGPQFAVTTWREENSEFFGALKLEKLGLLVILLLVCIVASFNIVGTLILMVMEKRPEIGILKAMGTSEASVNRIFLSSGLSIGLIGTACGLALGLAGALLMKYGIRISPYDSPYSLSRFPVIIKPLTVTLIVGASMLISLIAAVFPARQAARLDAVEALRLE